MYLKSLEVQGFKSFPDKTVIRFGDDITAIVGPNGSGKSNISDAILWVMGEQSTKTLRGAKMEDVIFGGTQKRAAVGFAEATLTLDNADRALPYDADEVMVTRRYYRSGDSEYYINRQSARLRDIHEMFMDTGMEQCLYTSVIEIKQEPPYRSCLMNCTSWARAILLSIASASHLSQLAQRHSVQKVMRFLRMGMPATLLYA